MSAGGFFTTIHNMMDVAKAREYLDGALGRLHGLAYGSLVHYLPCEDILCMSIPEIDLSWSSYGNSSGFSIPRF